MVNMVQVESSNVVAIGHDGNDLYVEYNSGHTYCYRNVPKQVYEALLAAPSKGSYMNENIKYSYDYKRI